MSAPPGHNIPHHTTWLGQSHERRKLDEMLRVERSEGDFLVENRANTGERLSKWGMSRVARYFVHHKNKILLLKSVEMTR